jgi:membrane protein
MTWWRATISAIRRVRGADLPLFAAAVAYNAFLALVPLTIAGLGVAAAIGQDAATIERVRQALEPTAPGAVTDFITRLLREAAARVQTGRGWLIAGSALVALAIGARAVVALQRALAVVIHRVEARPTIQMRLVGTALTVGGGAALLIASALLVVGRDLFGFLGNLSGATWLDEVWVWLRVPVSTLGLYFFVVAVYRWGPPTPLPRSWLAALIATAGVVGGSLLFGLYLSVVPDLGPTFGTLGAVAVAMVWLYVGALAILFGAVVVAPE